MVNNLNSTLKCNKVRLILFEYLVLYNFEIWNLNLNDCMIEFDNLIYFKHLVMYYDVGYYKIDFIRIIIL